MSRLLALLSPSRAAFTTRCALLLLVQLASTVHSVRAEAVVPKPRSGEQAPQRARAPDPPDPTAPVAAVGASGGVVNINSASTEELQRLPGIGPTRAQAILALRARLTRFTRLEQLLRVKGIGRATFRKLRPLLALQGETTLSAKPRSHRP